MRSDTLFSVFMVAGLVLMITSFILFHLNKNARFKRKYFPWFMILVGVLFIAVVIGLGAPLKYFLLIALLVASITFLDIRGTRFCDDCGRTIRNPLPFSRPEYCPKCGAKLDVGNRDQPRG
ncbi:MAG: hypothetical protein H0V83_07580 [Rubrobacter sp.]|nr:hypothetical protein [Rubrobacter sp.]